MSIVTSLTGRSPQAIRRALVGPEDRYLTDGPHLIPNQTMRCARCGTTFHPAALQDDRALLLASCCPRCDGPLLPENARAARRTDAVHTTG